MKSYPYNLASGVLFLTVAAGCVVGPDYRRPAVPAQASWKERPASTNAPVLPPEWWAVFNDPVLNQLEALAVRASQNLQLAAARVAEARALARVSRSELYPSVGGGAGYTRSRHSENRDAPLPQTTTDDFAGSFDLSYELDIWGRLRRQVEAANAEAGAATTDLQVVLLTLTADVARNYQWLRSLDRERRILEASIAVREDAVRLQQSRSQAGLINEVDLTRARTELANVQAELHAIVRARAQTEHALAVLCGQPPASISFAAQEQDVAPPLVPAGLPSDLLERRPDIVEAEQRLQAASAGIGVAKAEFFPKIKLTGGAGVASADLASLVDWPSRLAQLGPSVSMPVFQGGRNRASLEAAKARYEQNLAIYRERVLNAFREVEDSLSGLQTLAAQNEAVLRALESARDTVALASERYERGLSSYLDVVDAQRAALSAERQDAQLRGQRVVTSILLAKALGGGWRRTEEADWKR